MDIVFTDNPLTRHTSQAWPFDCDREELLTTLSQASAHARNLGHAVLVGFTIPVQTNAYDPLRLFIAFQSLGLGNSFFWERPAEQHAFVGTGIATSIETSGSSRVSQTAATWRALQRDVVVGTVGTASFRADAPVFFGGFAFDPALPRTSLWNDFPDGLLLLPHLLFHRDRHKTTLTVNTLLQPFDDVDQRADEIMASLLRLRTTMSDLPAPQFSDAPHSPLSKEDLLTPQEWQAQVAEAVQMIRNGMFDKVVLARGVKVMHEQPFDISSVLHRLRISYPGAYVFAIQRGSRYFVGATPERLICGADGKIQTAALAGSAQRGTTEEEDQRIGAELLKSAKNQEEHRIVVATIRDALARLCTRVSVADTPHLLKLKNIQHLETPISGDLLPGRSILEAIEDLHPTPAVGGFSRQPALEAIRSLERLDRGWYAGPIGWIGSSGNGEFAVALRSALIDGNQATLFAGCGIVADSNPESEYLESCLKLQVMLRGLGED